MLLVRPSTLLLTMMASAILVISATQAKSKVGSAENIGNRDGEGKSKEAKYEKKTIVNKLTRPHQYLQRAFPDDYGSSMLNTKADFLLDIMKKPMLGSHANFCDAMLTNCRSLFHYASFLLPEYSYKYYSSLGHLMQTANNATKRWYNDYYDVVSDFSGCEGEDAVIIIERLYEYYQKKLYVVGSPERRTDILREMASVNKSIHHLIWEDEVRFEPSCNLKIYREYFDKKMPELDRMVTEMNVEMSDDQVSRVLFNHIMITPMVSTFYLCVGYQGEVKKEVQRPDSIIYKIRQSFNEIMEKEEKREAHLMSGPQNADKALGAEYYRHTSIPIPAGSTLICRGLNTNFSEDKIVNAFNCGYECPRIAYDNLKAAEKDKEKACGWIYESPVHCDDCHIIVPEELYKDSDYSAYASVNIKMPDHGVVVVVLPKRNLDLPKLTLPMLQIDEMIKMANHNITPKVERPDNFFPHEYPQRQFYQKPRTTGKIDWRKICWEALYVHVATAVLLWTVYLSAAYYPWLRLWWRLRREHQD